MPRLGADMTAGKVVKWLKRPGRADQARRHHRHCRDRQGQCRCGVFRRGSTRKNSGSARRRTASGRHAACADPHRGRGETCGANACGRCGSASESAGPACAPACGRTASGCADDTGASRRRRTRAHFTRGAQAGAGTAAECDRACWHRPAGQGHAGRRRAGCASCASRTGGTQPSRGCRRAPAAHARSDSQLDGALEARNSALLPRLHHRYGTRAGVAHRAQCGPRGDRTADLCSAADQSDGARSARSTGTQWLLDRQPCAAK